MAPVRTTMKAYRAQKAAEQRTQKGRVWCISEKLK